MFCLFSVLLIFSSFAIFLGFFNLFSFFSPPLVERPMQQQQPLVWLDGPEERPQLRQPTKYIQVNKLEIILTELQGLKHFLIFTLAFSDS